MRLIRRAAGVAAFLVMVLETISLGISELLGELYGWLLDVSNG